MSKAQINPMIDLKLKNNLLLYATRRQIPYGRVVESALNQYFDPDNAERHENILYRRLDNISSKIDNLVVTHNILSEAFAIFVRNYLARLPDVPKEQAQAFAKQKEKTFKIFIDALADSISCGNSLFNRLPLNVFVAEQPNVT